MKIVFTLASCLLGAALAQAAEMDVRLSIADAKGVGSSIGSVKIVETRYGLAFHPNLSGLPPGLHGFHVHENPSCEAIIRDGTPVPAMAAGGHLDPAGTKRHGEPWGDGHLGDLPALYVAPDGTARSPVLGPRLKLADVKDRSLMVHAGADNHADHPSPLGGGGARIACGVIGG